MDRDHMAALTRGFFHRDFTGWHRTGHGGFSLPLGGYRVEYGCGRFHAVVMGEGVSGRFRIVGLDVDPVSVVMKGDDRDGFDWCLEDGREDTPLIHMAGAPLRRPENRVRWSDEFYDRGWPELEETSPVRPWAGIGMDDNRKCRQGREIARAASTLMCDTPELLFPDGLQVRTGWNTSISLRAEVWPQDPSDIRCNLSIRGDGWKLEAFGHGHVGEKVGFSSDTVGVCLVMTPYSSGDLEHLARTRANRFRDYRDSHPCYVPDTVGKKWRGSGGPRDSIHSFDDDVWMRWAGRW